MKKPSLSKKHIRLVSSTQFELYLFPVGDVFQLSKEEYSLSLTLGHRLHDPYQSGIFLELFHENVVFGWQLKRRRKKIASVPLKHEGGKIIQNNLQNNDAGDRRTMLIVCLT